MTQTPISAGLAALIIENLKGYAVLTLGPDGRITNWLGDAERVTGYTTQDARSMNLAALFTEPDQAIGAASEEIATALRDGRAEDSRWHRRKDGDLFWANGLTIRLSDEMLVKIFRDETPAKRAEEQRVVLLNELNHRVKNTLLTVQSVTEQTLRAAGVDPAVRGDLADRFVALARTHEVLFEENWAGADLHQLVAGVVGPYERKPSPFVIKGPLVGLHPSQAVGISLALHELATNAVKYGALRQASGRVRIEWNLAQNGFGDRFLSLLWTESGGPPVTPPTRKGFGSRLIGQTFSNQDGGRAEIDFRPDGVRCTLAVRLVDEAGTPALAESTKAVL